MERFRWPRRPLLWFGLAALVYAGICCWIGLASLPAENLLPRQGRLRGVAMEDGGAYLLLREASFLADGQAYDLGGVQLWAEGAAYVAKGQEVWAEITLSPVMNSPNPGAFDARRYWFTRGVRYEADGQVVCVQGQASYTPFERLRAHLLDRVEALWPEEEAQMLGLLLLGGGDVDPELRASYQASGAAHVLAVSGLHVGFVAALLSLLLWPLPRASLGRLLCLAAGLLGYCLLAGASASTQRASLMAAAVAAARWRGREGDGLSGLGLAVGCILLLDPRQLLGMSFQLSVSAMLGIVLLTERMERWLRFLPRFLRGSLAMTLAAQLGCLPSLLAGFGSVSLYAPLTNLLAVPLAGLAVPLGLLTLFLDGFLPALTPLPVMLSSLAVRTMNLVAEGFASLPLAELLLPKLPQALGLLWSLLLLALSELRARARLAGGLAAGGLCALALGLWLAGLFPSALEITFLSVGCADSAILRLGGATVVVDAGRTGNQTLDALQAEDPVVDALILTHGDADHSGGAENLLRNLRVRELCYPKGLEGDEDFAELLSLAQALGTRLRPVAAGDTLWYDDLELRVLWPQRLRAGKENADSLVLLVQPRAGGALLTADVGAESLAAMDLPKARLVKLPHHGSADGLSREQLEGLGAELAVLSVGANPYGLPAESSLAALEGLPVARTDEGGAVRVRFEPEGLRVRRFG